MMKAPYDLLHRELQPRIPSDAADHRPAAAARLGHRRQLLPAGAATGGGGGRRRRGAARAARCARAPHAGDLSRRRHQPVGSGGHRLGAGGARRRLERHAHRATTRKPIRLQAGRDRRPTPTGAWLRYGRKIGPDPASINACKIGGIAANNASGMCCGTAQNSYRTLAGMRVILADGTLAGHRRRGEPRGLFRVPLRPPRRAEPPRRDDPRGRGAGQIASATNSRSRTPPATA